jgi:hypothetical protein
MTRVVMVAAAVVGALALLGRWWRDARTDARLAQVDEPDAFVPMAAWYGGNWRIDTGRLDPTRLTGYVTNRSN